MFQDSISLMMCCPALVMAWGATGATGQDPLRRAQQAGVVALGAAVLALLGVFTSHAPLSGAGGWLWPALVHPDVVTATMLTLVCFLALVVVRYSRTYLAGEPGLARYARALVLTVASITAVVVSNNLAVLLAAWILASLGVHRLLTFYPGRAGARAAAHKKFVLSRAADVCFLLALVVVVSQTGSLRVDELNAAARTGPLSLPLHAAAVLLAAGVVLRSAQLPFHGWMTQVMEAPTPVSALLHAGVVNLGGFLLIRLAPLVDQAPAAQFLLVGVGLFTVVLAALVQMTRVSIKVALAWSTIAQMGFLLVQCGLGVWSMAMLHLVAHSLYKAHAFLSAAGVVQTWRGLSLVRATVPSTARVVATAAVLTGLTWVAATVVGAAGVPAAGLWSVPTTVVLVPALAVLVSRTQDGGWRAGAGVWLGAVAVLALSFMSHALFDAASGAPPAPRPAPLTGVVVLALMLLLFIQSLLQARPDAGLSRWLQPRLFSAFHLDEWFTRVLTRVWPLQERPATQPVPSHSTADMQEVRSW